MSTKRKLQPETAVDPFHEAVGSAVHVLAADDMVAGGEQLEDRIERRQPRAEGKAMGAPLQARDAALQSFPGGILGPGVLVPFVASEPLLDVGGGLVDRRHDGAGERVGGLAGVDGSSREAVRSIGVSDLGHAGGDRVDVNATRWRAVPQAKLVGRYRGEA